ncbi:hypothetical protein [Pedobacter alluvionis]|uniref:Uncharacterized protein n=1 Tax=Pedobacter alluvionis TaxID=475253 RepID=A0A497YDX8_9SPHI|nr:hypothetical protein [Pedobacter alluvionis]RLJ80697.1 hypothetical protein BCL90_1491 [Pedobacter alluvionis]TFB31949.1 hypothetical protein E3V97_15390 [Pedobacter alluvionis]
MNTYAKQKTDNESKTSNHTYSQKNYQQKAVSQFVDNRTKAVAQRQFQETLNNRYEAIQFKTFENNTKSNQTSSNVIQFGRGRPSFSGPAAKIRKTGNGHVKAKKYDMAHRLSLKDIKTIVTSKDHFLIKQVIKKVTIPERDFGKYKKGFKGYYNDVKDITDESSLIKALNNSPFNLRPGDPSRNRSLGAAFDGNVDDDGYETDQSKALRPLAKTHGKKDIRSSYLTAKELKSWEKSAYDGLDM